MSRYFKTLFAIVSLPLLMALGGCNSEGAFSDSVVKLDRIDIVVSPITMRGVSEVTLAKGNKQPFEAVGHYSDGSSHALTNLSVSDWHTSNRDIGHFDESGVLTGADAGRTTVTATKDGIISNAVNVEVTAAVIMAIQVAPSPVGVAKGQTEQLTAIATYSDNTSSDVSDSVAWLVDNTDTATVTQSGLLAGVDVGTTNVTATKDDVTSTPVNVDVNAAIVLEVTISSSSIQVTEFFGVQLKAFAHYSDNNVVDVTTTSTWHSGPNITTTDGLVEVAPFQFDGYVTDVSVTYSGKSSLDSVVTMRASSRSDVMGSETTHGVFIAADSHPELTFFAGVIIDAIYDATTGERLVGDSGGWPVGDVMTLANVKGDIDGISVSYFDNPTIKRLFWQELGISKSIEAQGSDADPTSHFITVEHEVFGLYVYQIGSGGDISGIQFIYR